MNIGNMLLATFINTVVLLICTAIVYFLNGIFNGWYEIKDCLLLSSLMILLIGYPSLLGLIGGMKRT